MRVYSPSVRRKRGFSLIEIMVGIAIGMLGVLIIMQVSSVFEGQKRTTTTGSDAQTNGVTALYTVERDVRIAGYGLSALSALGCTVRRYYDGAEIDHMSLVPIVVTNGQDGAPDSIEILASSKTNWSVPSKITVDHPPQATNIFLDTTLGIAVGDLLVAYEDGKDCTLMQATGIPNGNVQVHHQNTSPWNPPGGANIFPPGGYNVGAHVLNLGGLIDRKYSLKGGNLVLEEYTSADNSWSERAVAADIVNMQAEYGFDTRAGAQVTPRVDTWSATMIDADGDGTVYPTTNPDPDDIARIAAVRMVIVARSPLKEKKNAENACDVTKEAPTWAGGTIDVSGGDEDWKCYRYKTFENVIPLRNMMWKERDAS